MHEQVPHRDHPVPGFATGADIDLLPSRRSMECGKKARGQQRTRASENDHSPLLRVRPEWRGQLLLHEQQPAASSRYLPGHEVDHVEVKGLPYHGQSGDPTVASGECFSDRGVGWSRAYELETLTSEVNERNADSNGGGVIQLGLQIGRYRDGPENVCGAPVVWRGRTRADLERLLPRYHLERLDQCCRPWTRRQTVVVPSRRIPGSLVPHGL